MGREIDTASRYTPEDFEAFHQRLTTETALLCDWLEQDRFEPPDHPTAGFELEAWLVDAEGRPAPRITELMEGLSDAAVAPELAAFNMELNGEPQPLYGAGLSRLFQDLQQTWQRCAEAARGLGLRTGMFGILPSAQWSDFSIANMAPMNRYQALNSRVLEMREGRPLRLAIQGRDRLYMEQSDVMLEAAATSFQIHLQTDLEHAGRLFNASKMLSAPMVGLAANSPFLFGSDLWDETRIPLFEQAVEVGASALAKRVGFGVRYVHRSIAECFQANLHRYPPLLPSLFEEPPERLSHLLFHNGTIWRWNRPLVGFDPHGRPHIRLEHRVVPAGPSLADNIANAAFYFGCAHALSQSPSPLEAQLPFAAAKDNFYRAARYGLNAEVVWTDGEGGGLARLLLDKLLPLARSGLQRLELDAAEIEHWLGIVESRVQLRRNGALWQRNWVQRHGPNMQGLTLAMLERQETAEPVHRWSY